MQYLTESEVKRIGAMVVCKLLQCTLIDGDDNLMKVEFPTKCNSIYRLYMYLSHLKKTLPKTDYLAGGAELNTGSYLPTT